MNIFCKLQNLNGLSVIVHSKLYYFPNPIFVFIIRENSTVITIDISLYSRVDTDVLMEVAYSCNFLAVSDSSTCPDIGTS